MLRPLTEDVWVGGQITAADLADLKARGVKTIINNRPDNEMPGQPSGEALGKAITDAGLSYAFLPMMGGLTLDLVQGSEAAYNDLPKPIAAFCASGTRSVVLWCFANVNPVGVDRVLDIAERAGYSLGHVRAALEDYASS